MAWHIAGMRIDILAIGSRGDVQPHMALALGLQSVGHAVRLVTLGGFEGLVQGRGIEHLSIGASPQEIADTLAGRHWVAERRSALGFVRGFVRTAAAQIEAGMAAYWQACRDVEALIVSPMGLLVGAHVAERLRAPLIRTQASPRYGWEGRRTLAAALRTQWITSVGAIFNLLMWNLLRGSTNAARARLLALPPLPLRDPSSIMDRQHVPLLQAYSPAVVPRPRHWGNWIHVTGYWFLDDPPGWAPPDELVEFLAAGPAPVFVGFGSTPFPRPEAATGLVMSALARAGRRGVLVAGSSGLATGRLSDDVLSLDAVSHAWLFPRVCAAVHHGGAGVTGAALRAGLPAVVVPVFADQPFWGERVFKLGAGARPIPAKRLTVAALADAITATASPHMRRRAAELGSQIRSENGVAHAVAALAQHLGAPG